MAISYVGGGEFSAGTTTASASYPGGAASDIILALIANKPYGRTPTASEYTELTSITSGVIANAASTGSVRATAFRRNTSPALPGQDTFSVTSGSPTMATALQFARSAGSDWDVAAAGLADTDETGTTVSAGGSVAPGAIQSGDWVVIHVAISDDGTNHSSQSLTIDGCTIGGITWLAKNSTIVGNDGSQYVGYATVSAGSSTGAVTYGATSSFSGRSGTAVNVVRLREAAPAPPEGAGSGAWSFTGSATGKRTPRASATGSWSFVGASTGRRAAKGGGSGGFAFTGLASGKRSPRGAGTGGFVWLGAATGFAPSTLTGGSASGTLGFIGLAEGQRRPIGAAASGFQFSGVAVGLAQQQSNATGLVAWAGLASGKRAPIGAAVGWVTYHAVAAGEAPEPLYRFELPTYQRMVEPPPLSGLRRIPLTESVSIVRIGGTLTQVKSPSSDQLKAAGVEGEDWFLGGRIYTISSAVMHELEAAGYPATRI